jgi:hypothetical protein
MRKRHAGAGLPDGCAHGTRDIPEPAASRQSWARPLRLPAPAISVRNGGIGPASSRPPVAFRPPAFANRAGRGRTRGVRDRPRGRSCRHVPAPAKRQAARRRAGPLAAGQRLRRLPNSQQKHAATLATLRLSPFEGIAHHQMSQSRESRKGLPCEFRNPVSRKSRESQGVGRLIPR